MNRTDAASLATDRRTTDAAGRFGLLQALRTPQHACAILLAFLYFASQAWFFQHRLDAAALPVLTDFNDYHVVGRMVATGKAVQAYDWSILKLEQIAQTRNWSFMPWAYPPQFTMLTGVLGLLPIWAAYMLFIGSSWLLFYSALLRLSGRATVPALLIVLPAILINGKCGQSGFLSAGLIGWFLVAIRDRSSKGGWALGAMIYKPHLAAGIGLLTLLERRWGAIVRAGILVVVSAIVATVVLGPQIWPAFRLGTRIAGAYLWTGEYPLERMLTVFAALHRFGVPPVLALIIHLAFGGGAIIALLVAWRHERIGPVTLAIAACICLMISPYTYDYDGVALALALALVLPHFVKRANWVELPLAVLLCWIATSNYLWIGLRQIWYGVPMITADMRLWTISPIALAALAALIATVWRRPARNDAPWWPAYRWIGGKVPA